MIVREHLLFKMQFALMICERRIALKEELTLKDIRIATLTF